LPVAAVCLPGRYLALGLSALVGGDRLAGIDYLGERRTARIAADEQPVGRCRSARVGSQSCAWQRRNWRVEITLHWTSIEKEQPDA